MSICAIAIHEHDLTLIEFVQSKYFYKIEKTLKKNDICILKNNMK